MTEEDSEQPAAEDESSSSLVGPNHVIDLIVEEKGIFPLLRLRPAFEDKLAASRVGVLDFHDAMELRTSRSKPRDERRVLS